MNLSQRIDRIRSRLRWSRATEVTLRTAVYLLNGVALLYLMDGIRREATVVAPDAPALPEFQWWFPVVACSAVALGLWTWLRVRPTREHLALLIDRRAGLQEEVTTLLEHDEQGDPEFREVLHAHVERDLSAIENRRLVPGPRWRWAAGLLLPIVVMMILQQHTAHGSPGPKTEGPSKLPLAIADARPLRGVAPHTVTLRALRPQPGVEYTWIFKGRPIGTGSIMDFTLDEPGEWDFELMAERMGMIDHDILPDPVVVLPPDAPLASATFIPPTGPAPLDVTMEATDAPGNVSYRWILDGKTIGESRIGKFTFENEGTYDITLEASGPGGTDRVEYAEAVQVGPARPPRALFLGSPRTGTAPHMVIFDGSHSEGRITRWTWDFGDGQGAEGVSGLRHVYEKPGIYTVRLRVEGPGGSDVRTREDYIVVAPPEQGHGPGGGSDQPRPQTRPDRQSEPDKKPNSNNPGLAQGGEERDDFERSPLLIDPLLGEGAERAGMAGGSGTAAKAEEEKQKRIKAGFRRTIEHAIEDRELLPADIEYLKRFLEELK